MDFFLRLGTLIMGLLFIVGNINTAIQARDYYKQMQLHRQQSGAVSPLKKPLFLSIILTITAMVVFYLFGGLGFVHEYLYPPRIVKVKIVKIHDKVIIHDTISAPYRSEKKVFNNKIDKVNTLNQN
jgi:hypothetical protein